MSDQDIQIDLFADGKTDALVFFSDLAGYMVLFPDGNDHHAQTLRELGHVCLQRGVKSLEVRFPAGGREKRGTDWLESIK